MEPHDPVADRQALEKLAEWCERWSPLVGLEPGEMPQCLLLDLTGIGPLFGSEAILVNRALGGLQQQGYRALAAVEETIGAAWAQAWFAEQSSSATASLPDDAEHQRGIASQSRANTPLWKNQRCALPDLPVAALRLESQTLALLEELGLARIGQLEALPRGALAARFGGDAKHPSPAAHSDLSGEGLLLRRLDQLKGLVAEVIVPHRAAPDWEVSWGLEYSTASREVVERVIERLVVLLAEQLAERQREVVRLECRLKLAGREPVTLVIGLSQPSALPSHLAELIHLQLARLSLPAAVMGVALRAAELASRAERQQELFPDPSRYDSRQRAWLLDRLSNRLGEEAVVGVQPRGDPLPEKAFRLVPLTGSKKKASPSPAAKRVGRKKPAPPEEQKGSAHAPLHRPVLLMEAQPVAVMAIAPEGAPRRFTLQGKVYDIVRQWGPERIETGWWRGGSVRRDYYRVETASGEQFWIYRQLTNGEWRLQGVFG